MTAERLQPGRYFGIDDEIVDSGWLARATLRELKLYVTMARCSDSRTGRVVASTEKLVRLSAIPQKHIWKALSKLEVAGVIRIDRGGRTERGQNLPNTYWIVPWPGTTSAGTSPQPATHDGTASAGTTGTTFTGTTLPRLQGHSPLIYPLQESTPKKGATKPRPEDVLAVFDHYRTYHPRAHPNPRPDSKEWRKILDRLREDYTVEDLCLAIDGCHKSPHHCGENDRGTKYLGLELIVRDSGHVATFIEVATSPVERPKSKANGTWAGARSTRGRVRQRDYSHLNSTNVSGNGTTFEPEQPCEVT